MALVKNILGMITTTDTTGMGMKVTMDGNETATADLMRTGLAAINILQTKRS